MLAVCCRVTHLFSFDFPHAEGHIVEDSMDSTASGGVTDPGIGPENDASVSGESSGTLAARLGSSTESIPARGESLSAIPPTDGTNPLKVFVSHSSLDRADVERLIIRVLEKHGVTVFFAPQAMVGGEEWHKEILEALSKCTHFIVVLTPHAAKSRWVHTEVGWAFDHLPEGRIFPVYVRPCEVEQVHMLLRNVQFFDFLGNPAKATQRLLTAFNVEPRSVSSQLLVDNLTETLFGGMTIGLLMGTICGLAVGVVLRAVAGLFATLMQAGWPMGGWRVWMFAGAALCAALGGLSGVFFAAQDNPRLTGLLNSFVDKMFRGGIMGLVAWLASAGTGYFGGWESFTWWKVVVFGAVGLGIYDVIDTVLMLFERRRLRRLNTELFVWNTVAVMFISTLWALTHVAWGSVGAWTQWMLIGMALFSAFAVISAAVAASAGTTD